MSTLRRHENCIPTGRQGAEAGPQAPRAKRAGLAICLAGIAGWAVIFPDPLRGQESCDSGPGTWVEIESQTASVTRAKCGYYTSCSTEVYLAETFHLLDTYVVAVSGGSTEVYSTDTTQESSITDENRRNAQPDPENRCLLWIAVEDHSCTGQAAYDAIPDNGADCSTTAEPPRLLQLGRLDLRGHRHEWTQRSAHSTRNGHLHGRLRTKGIPREYLGLGRDGDS